MKIVARENTNIVIIFNLIKSEFILNVYFYKYEVIDERYFKHTLNAFFLYINSQYFSLIIKTSYSQRQKKLMKLIDEYIFGFDENIVIILEFDIEYGVKSKKTSLFI